MFKTSKRLVAMLICLAMVLTMLPMSVFAAGTTLYLQPNSNWLIDDARFAAYFFGNGDTWVSMTDSDGDGLYEVEAPEGYTSVIFCRMNPANTTNSWDNRWNQTSNLAIPTDGTNCYTVKDGTWDKGGGSWSTYSTDCSHVYDAGSVTTAATCTTAGEMTYTCTLCGATKTETIAATGHSYVDGVCSCGATGTVIYFDNTDSWSSVYVHFWGGDSASNWPGDAMTLVDGSIYSCYIPAGTTYVIFNNGNGTQTANLSLPTDGKDQYSYATGVWSVYGEAACTHANVTTLAAVAATCTTAGLTEGSVCADCGATVVAQEEVAALGHSFGEDNVCANCQLLLENITVYFESNWMWTDVCGYYWGSTASENPTWPGNALEVYTTTDSGYTVYSMEITTDIAGLIFNGKDSDGNDAQTPNIDYWYDGIVYYMNWSEEEGTTVGSYDVSNLTPSCDHAYDYDCSTTCNICGEETRPEAEHAYYYACDAYCMYCNELTNEEAAHTINHVEAVAGTDCQTWDGNVEYWYCSDCGACWLDEAQTQQTNRMSIVAAGEHAYDYDCSSTCNICGEETREAAHEYFYACDAYCMICGELTNEEAAHTVNHVDAVAATDCQTWDGNVEYWYCSDCGACWLDEAQTQVTNRMSVACAGEHSYENNTCTVCGELEYTVKFQAKNDGTAIRLLSYVGDLSEYASVTFNVTIGDNTTELTCTNAYKSLLAGGNQVAASSAFGEDAEYFVMYTLTNITEDYYDMDMTVSVTWTAVDGTETTSEARTVTIGDLVG